MLSLEDQYMLQLPCHGRQVALLQVLAPMQSQRSWHNASPLLALSTMCLSGTGMAALSCSLPSCVGFCVQQYVTTTQQLCGAFAKVWLLTCCCQS